jgi:hypothetical protein
MSTSPSQSVDLRPNMPLPTPPQAKIFSPLLRFSRNNRLGLALLLLAERRRCEPRCHGQASEATALHELSRRPSKDPKAATLWSATEVASCTTKDLLDASRRRSSAGPPTPP